MIVTCLPTIWSIMLCRHGNIGLYQNAFHAHTLNRRIPELWRLRFNKFELKGKSRQN